MPAESTQTLGLVFKEDCSLLLQPLLAADPEAWTSSILEAGQDAQAVPALSSDDFQVWNQPSTFVLAAVPTMSKPSNPAKPSDVITCLYLWNSWHVPWICGWLSESSDIFPLLKNIFPPLFCWSAGFFWRDPFSLPTATDPLWFDLGVQQIVSTVLKNDLCLTLGEGLWEN